MAAVPQKVRRAVVQPLRKALAVAAGAAAGAGLAVFLYTRIRRALRSRQVDEQIARWCEHGPAKEPVIECEVPIEHGVSGDQLDFDVVEVPVGLLFECERIRVALCEQLGIPKDELELVQALLQRFARVVEGDDDNEAVLPLPWIDVAALAQLTYWYDRRPQSEEVEEEDSTGPPPEERLSEAKFGRWTKKISREKVIYGTVALRTRSRGHLGQQVFRRPAGVDVTRLSTLQRAASLCGHELLLQLVEETMERLRPRNVARIPWEEVKRHTSKDDLWLLIDGKVYDVTPFLNLHPGGGQLIADAAAQDATSLFERTHGEGLRYSLRLLNQFFIGVCENPGEAPKAEPEVPTPEFLATIRSITGALHTFDEARATGEAQGMLK